jgi:hypothetical protein
MQEEKRKTVGQIYLDVMNKKDDPQEAEELRREMQKDYEKNIYECVERGLKEFEDDFFVHVETKKERLTPNVIRNYFIPRRSCPMPFYDQTLYRYHKNDGRVEFIWVIPSKDTCINYRDHALEVDTEEKELLQYILDFYDGTLQRLSDSLNEELYGRKSI